MKFTKELIEKAKTAKTAEELYDMAKAEDIVITAEDASKIFAKLNQSGELADNELDNVVGGGCGKEETREPYHFICGLCRRDVTSWIPNEDGYIRFCDSCWNKLKS